MIVVVAGGNQIAEHSQMNVQLHHAISDLAGVTGMAITDAILDGERDPARLAALANRRIKASRETLIKALQGDWRAEHLLALRHARATYAHYQQLVAECDQEIEAGIRAFEATSNPPGEVADDPPDERTGAEPEPPTKSPAKRFDLRSHLTQLFGTDLTLIPGIRESTALVLFAELGPDLSRSPTAAQSASWLNLCPHNRITGGRIITAHTPVPAPVGPPRRYAGPLKSLYRNPSSLGQHFRRMRARQGTPQATTATAHKLARIIYHLITHRVAYDDSILAAEERQDLRRFERRLRRQARALGFELTPQAARRVSFSGERILDCGRFEKIRERGGDLNLT